MASDSRDLEDLMTRILLRDNFRTNATTAPDGNRSLGSTLMQQIAVRACAGALVPILLRNLPPNSGGPDQTPTRALKQKLEQMLAEGAENKPEARTQSDRESPLQRDSQAPAQDLQRDFARALPQVLAEIDLEALIVLGGSALLRGVEQPQPAPAAPRDEYDMVRRLQSGRSFNMRNTLAPSGDAKPASYTVSCEHIQGPVSSEKQQRQKFYIAERDRRGETKNIKVLGHAEMTDWLRYKAGMACWQVQQGGEH